MHSVIICLIHATRCKPEVSCRFPCLIYLHGVYASVYVHRSLAIRTFPIGQLHGLSPRDMHVTQTSPFAKKEFAVHSNFFRLILQSSVLNPSLEFCRDLKRTDAEEVAQRSNDGGFFLVVPIHSDHHLPVAAKSISKLLSQARNAISTPGRSLGLLLTRGESIAH